MMVVIHLRKGFIYFIVFDYKQGCLSTYEEPFHNDKFFACFTRQYALTLTSLFLVSYCYSDMNTSP